MDQERWRSVEGLFHSALERGPEARQAFLDVACGGDIDLQRQVELLLAKEKEAGSFLETPAIRNMTDTETASRALLGREFGPHRIVSQLGAGGMGEVYRAHDSKLGRDVAIKILPDEFAPDPKRLARFRREARTLASLNHPNIAAIYGLEESGGMDCLVLELVDGESLHGPLPVPTALDRARQVAEALEAAHAKGIIHRDLKPANVKVTPQGRVKVLDFGLAKAIWRLDENQDLTRAAGKAGEETLSGHIVGTPGYMSPEQARGKEVDERTDVWAFGCLLYELLTGKRAFHSESNQDTMAAAVLERDPDWKALPPKTPAPVRELLRQCLQKDAGRRLQRISDARRTIEDVQRGSKRWRVAAVAAAGLAMVAIAAALWLRGPVRAPDRSLAKIPASAPSAELTQKRLTFNPSESPIQSGGISPDGKYLAYLDPAGIHVKLFATEEERLIPRPAGVSANAYWVVGSWFPDGTQFLAVAFEQGGRMTTWAVSVLGQQRLLREGGAGWEVSPDGTHISFAPGYYVPVESAPFRATAIWVMGSQGDNPQKVLAAGEHEGLMTVRWSPGGRRLAFVRQLFSPERVRTSLETCDLKGMNRTAVMQDMDVVPEDFRWLPDGRIVYAREDIADEGNSNLWEIGIDNRAGTPTGRPRRITSWAGSVITFMSASANGKRLMLLKETDQWQTFVGELTAGGTRLNRPHRLTNNEASERPTAWTKDSKAVLFTSNRSGNWGIYKQGVSQETPDTVITGKDINSYGRLSPDGGSILIMENPTARPARLMRVPVSGEARQLVLETRNSVDFRCARAPASLCVIFETIQDGKRFVITGFDPLKGRGTVLRTIENDPLHPYGKGELSPDGSLLVISRLLEAEIHLRLLSLSGGPDREITVRGWPNITGLDWSPDGKGFYVGSLGTLLYVNLTGNARVLWRYKGADYILAEPSPDGRSLAIGAEVSYSNVWMVEGF